MNNGETQTRYVPETMPGGVAVFDYNNDGRLDVFFANGAEMPSLRKTSPKYWSRLFRNKGDAAFTDVTEAAGLAGSGYDMGAAVGDYNNDGYQDLFVGGVHHNVLYRNNGDGTFTDVTAQAGLGKPETKFGPLWSVGGVWLDVNNDGNLDLFVTNYLAWNPDKEPTCLVYGKRDYCHPRYYGSTPNRLYVGDGKGTFTDVSASSGVLAHPGKGMGAATADFDGDGWVDIFVTNDKLANSLFHNLGHGKFREIAHCAIRASQGSQTTSVKPILETRFLTSMSYITVLGQWKKAALPHAPQSTCGSNGIRLLRLPEGPGVNVVKHQPKP